MSCVTKASRSRGSYITCPYSIKDQGVVCHQSLHHPGAGGCMSYVTKVSRSNDMSLVTTASRSRGSYITCHYSIKGQGVVCHLSLHHSGAGGHTSCVTKASRSDDMSLVTTSSRSTGSYVMCHYSIQEQGIIRHLSLHHPEAGCHMSVV